MLHTLLSAYFNSPSREEVVAVYKYCQDNEYQLSHQEKENVFALHLSQWEFLSEMYTIQGKVYAHSFYTFQCWVFLTRIPKSVGGVTMRETFPLIRIPSRWNHEKYYETNVNNWSLQITTDTLEGLEWHVCSDVWFGGRTHEWVRQAVALFELLKARVFDLIQEDDLPDIINMKEYRTMHSKNDFAIRDEIDEVGYESDEGKHRTKKMKFDSVLNLTKFNTIVARVNSDFLMDADALITTFELRLRDFVRLVHSGMPRAGACDVSALRVHLFRRVQTFNPKKATSSYFDWVQTIVFSSLYRRNHARKNGMNRPCVPKHVIISKNPQLVELLPTTITDIIERKVSDPSRGMYPDTRIRLAGDYALHNIGQESGGITAALIRTDAGDDPILYREPFSNQWICQVDQETRFLCMSYAHAFIWLRHVMRERGMPPVVRKTDISQFDTIIFPPNNGPVHPPNHPPSDS